MGNRTIEERIDAAITRVVLSAAKLERAERTLDCVMSAQDLRLAREHLVELIGEAVNAESSTERTAAFLTARGIMRQIASTPNVEGIGFFKPFVRDAKAWLAKYGRRR